jgi:hypothetical protein
MCFSAEASFVGAAALAVIGSATLNLAPKRNKLWAAIPILFALQQFCEGIVWLDLRGTIPHSALTVLAKDLFLFFALVFWPIWLPFSFLMAETDRNNKIALLILLFFGFVVTYFNLQGYSILNATPSLNKHSVNYLEETHFYYKMAYMVVVGLPPFFSSLKYMKIFGVLIILSCLATEYFYFATFTSVWCFFAGLVTGVLYLIARTNFVEAEQKLIHK